MTDAVTKQLWNRIKRLLPRSHDPTVVLLKGHLLVEEQLFACIASHCRDATKLEDARLTFAQKLRLAQALCGIQSLAACRNSAIAHEKHANVPTKAVCAFQKHGYFDRLLAHSLEKLNALRNRMAHRVEVPDFDSRLDDYLKAWAEEEFVQRKTRRERTRDLRNTLIIQIAMLAGMSEAAEYLGPTVSHARRA